MVEVGSQEEKSNGSCGEAESLAGKEECRDGGRGLRGGRVGSGMNEGTGEG